MDVRQYFLSLTQELDALKDRVRNIINDTHWLTDGEWKESVLRQVIKRYLIGKATVGRGFVVNAVGNSSQIDILIHDSSKPVLFQDGDLVFVTPDAVLGVIEVKTTITPGEYSDAVLKLADNMRFIRQQGNPKAFSALFSFSIESSNSARYLTDTSQMISSWNERIDFASIGPDRFVKYWDMDPKDSKKVYEMWHDYLVPGLSAGYFIHNVIDSLFPESVFKNNFVWFPPSGKEPYVDNMVHARWAKPQKRK